MVSFAVLDTKESEKLNGTVAKAGNALCEFIGSAERG
jgi:hypothetical protein